MGIVIRKCCEDPVNYYDKPLEDTLVSQTLHVNIIYLLLIVKKIFFFLEDSTGLCRLVSIKIKPVFAVSDDWSSQVPKASSFITDP